MTANERLALRLDLFKIAAAALAVAWQDVEYEVTIAPYPHWLPDFTEFNSVVQDMRVVVP